MTSKPNPFDQPVSIRRDLTIHAESKCVGISFTIQGDVVTFRSKDMQQKIKLKPGTIIDDGAGFINWHALRRLFKRKKNG